MIDTEKVGAAWLKNKLKNLTDHIEYIKPSSFNEEFRYLPSSVSAAAGYLRYDVAPFMREIVDCFDVRSPIREVNLLKGAQVTYTTSVLEAGLLYFMAFVKTLPIMYITADKELAKMRVDNNFVPMLNHSNFYHIIQSSDVKNKRKTGKTEKYIQFTGGGYLTPEGAKNADKMRQQSYCVILKDEIDGWPRTVGSDGDPDALTDARASGYWKNRKIFRGSTPLVRGLSKIDRAYKRGDQRKYYVRCIRCGFAQVLRWHSKNEAGVIGGFRWEMENRSLLLESVRYCCQNCGFSHYEPDKEILFSSDNGSEWRATSIAVEPGIRSYFLPGMYTPIGLQPWYLCVSKYLDGFDPIKKEVIDYEKFQVFYNNILAKSFEIRGSKIMFRNVSGHRRTVYAYGQIPNRYAKKYSGSEILFVTCQVDVHKKNLAVAIMGWTVEARCYLIEYLRLKVHENEIDCTEISSPVWGRLREIIEEKIYIADDNLKYRIILTFIDAGYANDTVVKFCSEYDSGVYPILGRDRPLKSSKIKEFSEFKTALGTTGFNLFVDHYKDRMAPILRREWFEMKGLQGPYHFNAPVDITNEQLEELTAEIRVEKKDQSGRSYFIWHRPSNKPNELWDLLGYGFAGVDFLATSICVKQYEMETVNWFWFWNYLQEKKPFIIDC